MVKQVGKLVRQLNQDKPVKLNLKGFISSQSLGYLLSGMKGNTMINELNLSQCGLVDEDLVKIAQRLMDENGIKTLKIGQNQFRNIYPLIQLLNEKGKQYKSLDISNIPIDNQAM